MTKAKSNKVALGNKKAAKSKVLYTKVGVIALGVIILIIIGFYVVRNVNKDNIPKELKNDVLATVNGEKLYECEFNAFVMNRKAELLPKLLKDNENMTDEIWSTEIDGKKASDIVKQGAMEDAVNFKIQLLTAKQSGFSLDENEVRKIKSEMELVKKRGDDTTQKNFFKLYGLNSEEEYLFFKQEETLVNKFRKATYEGFEVISDKEAMDYYKKNLSEMFTEKGSVAESKKEETQNDKLIPFDEAKQMVYKAIYDEKYESLVDDWKSTSKIEINYLALDDISIISIGKTR